MSSKENIRKFLKYKGIKANVFSLKTNLSNGFLTNNGAIGSDKIHNIIKIYPEINLEWLITGKEPMLKETAYTRSKNLIPLYEDVATMGGSNVVETGIDNTHLQIDAGDWFNGATAAIRYYEDNMIEYHSGCILVIRELKNKDEIIWGRNYVIETSEIRITKQIAKLDEESIICYSTNTSTYPDGRLKYQPIKILRKDILHISCVLGSVNKEESTGKVQLL